MKVTVKGPTLADVAKTVTDTVTHEMERRSYLAANELRNASQKVLRGQRTGRRYKVPGTYKRQKDKVTGKMRNGRYYTASAPGEPPAVRTGVFRMSWQPTARVVYGSYISRIESDVRTDNGQHNLGQILEEGTRRMAPRPYKDRILDMAEPQIFKIYNKPYF